MDSRHFWDENGGPVKYENYNSNDDGYGRPGDGNLNFSTGASAEEDADFIGSAYLKKGKQQQQDPMSHRIIEKRRRDRMNNCLADLSRLIPPDYCKKGRGRVEKTEIIEMAIRHLKFLQERSNTSEQHQEGPISVEHFRLGYQECRSEVMRYLVEAQGYPPTDPLCVHLVGHLARHCDNILKGDQLNHPRSNPETTSSSSGGSSSAYTGDKPSVIAQPHMQQNNRDYRKRPFEELQGPYTPSPDEYINLACYDDEAPAPLTRSLPPPTLRNVRKLEREELADHAHSYKFKNTIKQRFSQDCDEAHDMSTKRRREPSSASQSLVSSNDEGVCRDASPASPRTADPRDPPDHIAPEPPPRDARVPIFALNSPGKYYIPLSVSFESIAHAVAADALSSLPSPAPPLHPVTINVDFRSHAQPVKVKVDGEVKWRPA